VALFVLPCSLNRQNQADGTNANFKLSVGLASAKIGSARESAIPAETCIAPERSERRCIVIAFYRISERLQDF
jgi:hypothetical protein